MRHDGCAASITQGQRTAAGFGERAGDGEAEAGAALFAARGKECVEYARGIRRRDTIPIIGKGQGLMPAIIAVGAQYF